jgi:hypothetical protein
MIAAAVLVAALLVESLPKRRDDPPVARLGTWLDDNINWLKNQLTRRRRASGRSDERDAHREREDGCRESVFVSDR